MAHTEVAWSSQMTPGFSCKVSNYVDWEGSYYFISASVESKWPNMQAIAPMLHSPPTRIFRLCRMRTYARSTAFPLTCYGNPDGTFQKA